MATKNFKIGTPVIVVKDDRMSPVECERRPSNVGRTGRIAVPYKSPNTRHGSYDPVVRFDDGSYSPVKSWALERNVKSDVCCGQPGIKVGDYTRFFTYYCKVCGRGFRV